MGDASAALSLGRILKVSDVKIKKAFNSSKVLPGRLEFIVKTKGISYVNDTASFVCSDDYVIYVVWIL